MSKLFLSLETYSIPNHTNNKINEDGKNSPGSLSGSILQQEKLNTDKSVNPGKDAQFLYGVIHHIHHFLDAYRDSQINHSGNLNPSNNFMNQPYL